MTFSILFNIAINLVFFPMHFTGLAGLPRRIPLFPDSYNGWATITTLGTILTIISTLLFLYMVSNQLFINKSYIINRPAQALFS